jgi:hypothetical protein
VFLAGHNRPPFINEAGYSRKNIYNRRAGNNTDCGFMDNRAGPWINLWTASCPQAYPQPCWKPVTHKLHSFGGGLPDLMQQWSLPD